MTCYVSFLILVFFFSVQLFKGVELYIFSIDLIVIFFA